MRFHHHPRRTALTLTEVLVILTLLTAGVILMWPRGGCPESPTRARCAANLRAIATAYQLWAPDNGGFLPPRCRSNLASCIKRSVAVDWTDAGERKLADDSYAADPHNGLEIVGQPTLKPNAKKASTNPTDYNNADQLNLNRYINPRWKLGDPFEMTRCPSDKGTLRAPANVTVAGIKAGAVTSAFDLHGTSYGTNIQPELPWRGHGPWAEPVETESNRQAGPNFNPEAIHNPSRYIVSADLAVFFDNWEKFLVSRPLGRKAESGRWHEAAQGAPWQNANALFADGHVSFNAYPFPTAQSVLTDLHPYQALYPLPLAPKTYP